MTKTKTGRKPNNKYIWQRGETAVRKWFRFMKWSKSAPVIKETLYLTSHGRMLAYRHSGKMDVIFVCTDIGKWAKSGKWDEVPLSTNESEYLKEWKKSQEKAVNVANPVD